MDGEEQVVISAGNSWVICRSKSYSGRIYYFNTLTGEAAWNLSDAEVEKAKQRTKNLAKQNKINIQECPEPDEPPMDSPNNRLPPETQQPKPSPSRVYNKQIINNKITRQSYPYPFMVPSYNVVTNPINPVLPLAVNSTPAYNTNIWAVPPTHQLYIGPSVPPLVTESRPTPVNVAFNNQEPTFTIQNTTSTLSGRFQNLRNTGFHGTQWRGHYRKPNFTPTRENYKFRQHKSDQYHNNFKKNIGVHDLRTILSAKKQRRASFHAEYNTGKGFEAESVAANTELSGYNSENELHDNETPIEKKRLNDADSDWLEENILVEDRRLKLDISNLKKLAKPNMDPQCWYIVADKDVLLHHLNFLNILCNSDDDCHLMVAQQVMAELHEGSRDKTEPRTAARARRAVSFLLQQLDAGYVTIGDGSCEENETRCDYLLNCCSNLYQQNYHVVLLSNVHEFEAYKNSTNIPIFNIKEIKQFLTKSVPGNRPDRLKSPPPLKSEIPKADRLKPPPCVTKTHIKHIDSKSNISTMGTQFNGDVETIYKCVETVPEENYHTSHVNNSISPEKYTVETGVQTDEQIEAESIITSDNEFILPQIKQIEVFEKTPEKDINKHFMTPHLGKREIRLNRSVSTKTSASSEDTSANVEMKHFKWRRKRHVSSTANNSKLSSATSSNADENSRDSLNIQKADKVSTSCEQPLQQNNSEESLSSEVSSLFITRNLTNGTLTVEETSTSGIISNSASNVDSESEGGIKATDFNDTGSQKSVMYEVTDQRMEDCLRTMNDEWVSRFIQIMEEVLTQVLQKDEKFLNDVVYKLHGGGPWNIREAADCIKIKFSNNSDTVDAASKLTNIYMKISDRTGRITANLQPSEFMEMYSFGKYLIESMLSVLQNCEDLESAAQSLHRLLADIQEPNFDASHNETFDTHPQNDIPPPTAKGGMDQRKGTLRRDEEVIESNSPEKGNPRSYAEVIQANSPGKSNLRRDEELTQSNSPGKGSLRRPEDVQSNSPVIGSPYSLRSRNKSCSQNVIVDGSNEKKNNTKFIRNLDIRDNFFTSLNLVKKTDEIGLQTNGPHSPSKPGSKEPVVAAVASSSQDILIRSIFNRNVDGNSQGSQGISSTESKVIRKFTVCPQFEKKFKKPIQREPLDMDHLDYSATYEDRDGDNYMNEEYYPNEENYHNDHDKQTNARDTSEEEIPVIRTDPNAFFRIDDVKFICDSPLSKNNNLNFIFHTIIRRVREALLDVQTFCKESQREFTERQKHSIRIKHEMNKNAERAQSLLCSLIKNLHSIFYRETYEPEKNIQSLLKDSGINDFDLNDNQLKVYRDVIGQCLEQAQILQESISLIITVIKKKPIE